MALIKSMVSSNDNTWETPQWLFDELNKEYSFTLDPCCEIKTAKCHTYFTKETNGLKQDWSKDIVFMNPPYGGNTRTWIKKAYTESQLGSTVVCLIVSSTDRSYWHDYIFPFADQIRFIRGRLSFGNVKSTAPFASAIVVFDKNKVYSPTIVYYGLPASKRKIMKLERQVTLGAWV